MWRRVSAQLHTLAAVSWRSSLARSNGGDSFIRKRAFPSASSFFSTHQATSHSDASMSKGKIRVEDIMPIATGHEREELEAELEGARRFDMDTPVGPFGTKEACEFFPIFFFKNKGKKPTGNVTSCGLCQEAPAIVKSYYDKRIVGCPGGEGEDEHDVVWFWLEKDKPHECPVCSQHFVLEVIGEGGPPDGHGHDDH